MPNPSRGATTAVPGNLVEITIDQAKCRFSLYDPQGCKRCMEICPAVVFGCVPAQKRAIGVSPTIYKLTTPWAELCNGCGACVKACPTNAITVKMAA